MEVESLCRSIEFVHPKANPKLQVVSVLVLVLMTSHFFFSLSMKTCSPLLSSLSPFLNPQSGSPTQRKTNEINTLFYPST